MNTVERAPGFTNRNDRIEIREVKSNETGPQNRFKIGTEESLDMMHHMRGKIGTYFVGGLVSLIAAVFIFEGMISSKSTRGLHEGAVAGTVNGEVISIGDFNRMLERKLEFLKGIMGDKISEEQMKMFRIREGAFQELVQQRLMIQQAGRAGIQPSDEEIRAEIIKVPSFQKDGKFDPMLYKQVLQANNLQSATFEKSIRDQLAADAWTKNIMAQVKVSSAEVREEYMMSQEQRTIKVVSLLADAPKAGDLTPKEAADKAAALLRKDKAADAAVNALLKPYSVTVREIPNLNKSSGYIPGLGDEPAIWNAVFGTDDSLTKQAKVFTAGGRLHVLLVTEMKRANPAAFEKDQFKISAQLREKKSRDLLNTVMKQLTDQAKIDPNPAVVTSGADNAG